jgi:hypothetical protein
VTSGDAATLLLPAVLTALLYALLLFVLASRRRTVNGPRELRAPPAPPAVRQPPRLRVVAGGRRDGERRPG